MKEIAQLPLDGRVVVLSGCDTARGKLLRGEGVISLARAFFEARASAVVASLWPQWDDDAAKLFERFYRHVAEGKSLAAALAAAQRDRMDDGAPTAAWAGFVVLGDGDLVLVPGGRSWLALNRRPLGFAAGAIALLALAGALFRVRRSAPHP
jgi:CHAT domain-containing protein